ncbi:phosphatidylinositol phosphate synthase [Pseudactinotalea sp. HY158]|uniref:phosphatidylinositol phosphate synthase n=1 Tax=Pseudactinotalea sp. HY158 TaxID=2654547 RepID=UPI00129C8E32|nr:CDP-alcohol phosphatidyltransferase family protein [Pseudactinotalea sp. HY158]QGH69330.1 CDP-alcohol phosphatidyltransferase family protein [Pseudactinotalea sp. HY158]
MVLGNHGRGVQAALFTPFARLLLSLRVSPNAVTIAGTVFTSGLALWLLPTGHLVLGALLLGFLALADSVDGVMARLTGRDGPYGAFLDSTLDRVTDAAIFAGVLFWFVAHTDGAWQVAGMVSATACLALGSLVSYARAKAEALGVRASVGIAERADRIIVVLAAVFLTGLGVPSAVLALALALLAVASLVTVLQRMAAVSRQLRTIHG